MKNKRKLKNMAVFFGMLYLSLDVAAQPRIRPTLQPLINRTWRNLDTSRSNVAKFHIGETGTVDLYYYDSARILQNKTLAFDRFFNNMAIFKATEGKQCLWFAVSTEGLGAIAGTAKFVDSSADFYSIFVRPRRPTFGQGSPCPPDCGNSPVNGTLMYFSSVTCCINHDHSPHDCGSTDRELANLSQTKGCIFP